MRLKGSVAYFREKRDAELIAQFRAQLSLCRGEIRLPEILQRTVNSPSSQFWVSVDRAMQMVRFIRDGGTLDGMGECRKEMFTEIERRVSRRESQAPTMRLEDIVREVIEAGAPKFYITVKSAKTILHYIKKRCRTKTQK